MFLSDYFLPPAQVDAMTGNEVYMIMYQRYAKTVNHERKSLHKRGNADSMDGPSFIKKFGG